MMDRRFTQHAVRIIAALYELAASCDDAFLRQDLTRHASDAIDLVMTAAADERAAALRRWCTDAGGLLAQLNEVISDERVLMHTRILLLRFQSLLVVPAPAATRRSAPPAEKSAPAAKAPAPRLHNTARVVLALVQSNPGIRTSMLMEQIGEEISARTVARSLKELVSGGLITRSKDGSAVAYEAAPKK